MITTVVQNLFEMQDTEYKNFHSKLLPNIDEDKIIGVRTPQIRKYAVNFYKSGGYIDFLNDLPHNYYDENQLHALIISQIRDYDIALKLVNKFLPYVDNWATCDQLNPIVFKNNTDIFINQIYVWLKSEHTYTIRFGIDMLMKYYLDDNFKNEYLEAVCKIHSEEYYVNMAIAWFLATALSKQYEAALPYLAENRLDAWVHNKTIQKARESFRITTEQKDYLKSLKR